MVAANATFKALNLADFGQNMKEDVTDIITNIDPTETPCLSNFGKGEAHNTFREWLKDDLAAAIDNNAHVDGDDFGTNVVGDTTETPKRLGNYLQIAKKQAKISGRTEAVDKYGRAKDYAYQVAKKGLELRRDMESSINANVPGSAEVGATAARLAGIPAWIRTNDEDGGGAAAAPTLSDTTYGYPDAARVAGTAQALSEADIRTVIQECYTQGGKVDCLKMHPTVKDKWSQYMFTANAKIATPYQDHGKNPRGGVQAVGAVDVYVSDFGVLDVIPNRFMPTTFVFVLQKSLWKVDFLRGYMTERLSKVGDSERFHIIADFTLRSLSEEGSGIVADVDNTQPMTA